MNYTDLLKRAFHLTWRYKPLWLFGFILALCGGGQSGGGANFNFPGSSSEFGDLGAAPGTPNIDPTLLLAVVAGLVCLILLLAVVAIVAQYVARTALIGMVRQIETTESVTMTEGWRLGWSRNAWRTFLVSLLIGIPLMIISIVLILLALSPLLLLAVNQTAWRVTGIILAVAAVIMVVLILVAVGAVIRPFRELAWRGVVLDQQGVIASLRDAVGLVKSRFKDVAIVWLLMIGIGIGWGLVTLVVILPVSIIAALLIGGIPAGLVYLMSQSWIGAAVTGIPLGLLVLILLSSAVNAFYLIFQSAVWTLTYLAIIPAGPAGPEAESPVETPPTDAQSLPAET